MFDMNRTRMKSVEIAEEFSPLLNQILNADTASDSQNIAISLGRQITDLSVPLFSSMVAAVSLYVNDQGACDPTADMTEANWHSLLLSTNGLVGLEVQARKFYLQIGNGVDVANSSLTRRLFFFKKRCEAKCRSL